MSGKRNKGEQCHGGVKGQGEEFVLDLGASGYVWKLGNDNGGQKGGYINLGERLLEFWEAIYRKVYILAVL